MITKTFTFASAGVIIRYIPDEKRGEPTIDTISEYVWHSEGKPSYKSGVREEWTHMEHAHRYDGPAIIDSFEEPKEYWYIYGEAIDEEEYKAWLVLMGIDINNLTPEDKVIIDMKWKKDAGPTN